MKREMYHALESIRKRHIKTQKWLENHCLTTNCTCVKIKKKIKHDAFETEPDGWITENGNHIPVDKEGNPIGGQVKALGEQYTSIGVIQTDYLEKEFGKLATNEIVVTNEREEHIKESHPDQYDKFVKVRIETVTDPDYVFKDEKDENTADYVRAIGDSHNMFAVVRVSLESDSSRKKNSVITAHEFSNKKLEKFKRNHKILYQREK